MSETPSGGDPGPPYPPYQPYGAPPPPPPFGGPQLYPAPRPTNGLAIASMVVSIVAGMGVLALCGVGGLLGIAGAIMGHVSRGQVRRMGQQGDGFALAGIIVGWVTFAVGVVALVVIVIFLIAVGHVDDPYTDTGTSI